MLNKVCLIGRLGVEVELRQMPNGNAVATIRLATTRRWKDKQSGDRKEETEWHRVVFFSRLAEIAGEYLNKGSLIYVEGRLRTQKWQDSSGSDRYTTEVVADVMQMLDSKGGLGAGNTASQAAPSSSPAPAGLDDFDDVPF